MTNEQIPRDILKKSESRLAAVKALYSNEVSEDKKKPTIIVLDFISLYQNKEEEFANYEINEKFFKELVIGTFKNIDDIDQMINFSLGKKWKIQRLGAVLLSILRVAIFELCSYATTPHKVIINEYIKITSEFFDKEEVGFINGILDSIAKRVS